MSLENSVCLYIILNLFICQGKSSNFLEPCLNLNNNQSKCGVRIILYLIKRKKQVCITCFMKSYRIPKGIVKKVYYRFKEASYFSASILLHKKSHVIIDFPFFNLLSILIEWDCAFSHIAKCSQFLNFCISYLPFLFTNMEIGLSSFIGSVFSFLGKCSLF